MSAFPNRNHRETVLHADGVIGNRGKYALLSQRPTSALGRTREMAQVDQKVNHCSMITGTHFPRKFRTRMGRTISWPYQSRMYAQIVAQSIILNPWTCRNPQYEVIISLPKVKNHPSKC